MKEKYQEVLDKHSRYSLHGKPDRTLSLVDELHALRYQVAMEVYAEYASSNEYNTRYFEEWLTQQEEQ